MSNFLKRRISLAIVGIFLVTNFVGCGSSDTTNTDKSTVAVAQASSSAVESTEKKLNPDEPAWKLDTSPVTLKWFLDANWYKQKWGESVVSKNVTEKTGVSIEFIVPSGDPNEKLSTLMASNSLPDMLSVGFWESNFKKLTEGGFVQPLNKLADQYDPYFYKVAGDACLKWYKQADGNTYCLPNEAYSIGDMKSTGATNANQTFLVRKDIYEEMGSPDMRTTEGFLNTLKLVKEKYSTYKGQKITPFFSQGGTYGLEEMLQNFLAIPYEKDGKIYDRYTDPDYITWIKTFRKAYEVKALTMDFLVDTAPQVDQKTNNASYFCMMREWTGVEAAIPTIIKKDPTSVYMAVDGPSNAKLEPAKIFAGSMTGWLPVFISKNCKNPDRAIRFMSYWASEEGQKDMFLGKKGETWDTIDGKDQLKPALVQELNSDSEAFSAKYGATDTYWQLRNPVIVLKWRPSKIPAIQQMLDWSNKHADYDKYYVKDLDPLGNIPEGIILTKIQQDWAQTLPKLITSKSDTDFDKIWNDFIKRREDNGFVKVQAYRQAQMDASKAKLN